MLQWSWCIVCTRSVEYDEQPAQHRCCSSELSSPDDAEVQELSDPGPGVPAELRCAVRIPTGVNPPYPFSTRQEP